MSQGDNWFIFHLLFSTDLINLQCANAHFSNDILSVLLNEPIPGQGIFWSSASKRAYPIPNGCFRLNTYILGEDRKGKLVTNTPHHP